MTPAVAEALRRRSQLTAHAVLALVVYPALLATQRGQVVADTKQYLTLDPTTMLRASTSLWDPDWALGTVTHQSIGYLWPMGPWFAGGDALGIPMWVTQRLWIATILFAAGAGILFLGRVLGWSTRASFAAGMYYALSPYALTYATRISALILPWAALPWLLGLAIRALRDAEGPPATRFGRWRDPARLALVTVTVGSVNASSLLYVGLAIVAWFPFAVWVVREATWRAAAATVGRIGLCCSIVSAWWAVALVVQGAYGPDVLAFSETLEVVASGSPASEAWRSLGYWVFYGGDRTGPWVSAGQTYTESVPVLGVTFGLALVALAALLFVRWRYRAYCLGLALAGLVLTIGLYPYDDPSPLGAAVSGGAAETTLALALRSSPRAMPLFLLAVACSFAVGIDALAARRPDVGVPAWQAWVIRPWVGTAAIVALVALAIPPLWQLRYVGDELARDETLPESWRAAADHLDAGDPNDRVLILPGADFSAHRWGNTIDHVLPGIVDRPVAVRELIPYGGAAAADLLIALDRRAQERLLEPSQVVPVARLLGVGDVIAQSDLEFERYRTPRPDDLWHVLSDPVAGFASVVPFGPPTENEASAAFPMVDEVDFDLDPALPHPPPVAALAVPDPLGVVRVRPDTAPILVLGDGESLLELAGAGLLDTDRLVLYAAALTDAEIGDAIDAGATLVITDGNRDRARRWKTVRDNLGLTESRTGDGLEADPTDTRLDVFPDAGPDEYSTTVQRRVLARSSSYGNPISFHPEDRAFHAVDGDLTTAWRAGTFTDARGEWLDLTWTEPTPATSLTLVQTQTLLPNRHITELAIAVDGGLPTVVTLDERSRTPQGQTIPLPGATVERLRLTVVETDAGDRPGYGGLSGIGFAEVFLDDEPGAGTELVATPTMVGDQRVDDLAGLTAANDVQVVLARERVDDSSPARDDPETGIRRSVTLPADRTFSLRGTARVTGRATDRAIDTALRSLAGQDPATVPFGVADERLPGDATHRTSTLVDGDPTTVFRPPIGPQVGRTFTIDLGAETTVDELAMAVVADGRHSVPLAFDVAGDDGSVRRVTLEIDGVDVDGDDEGATVTRRARFDPLRTTTLRFTVVETRPVVRTDWYAARPVEQPIGIATIDIPGVAPAPLPDAVQSPCRDDLVRIDGRPVAVRLVGTLPDTDDRSPLDVVGCERVDLGAGAHDVVTASRASGISIDRLVLDGVGDAPAATAPPAVEILERGRDTTRVRVRNTTEPFWLVLGESWSEGWEATVAGGPSLGSPTLVDGFANGWRIDPADLDDAGDLVISLTWTPNRTIRLALLASGLGTLVVAALAIGRRPRRPASSVRGTLGLAPADVTSPVRRHIGPTVVTLGAALVTGALTRPLLGVGFAVAVVAAERFRHGRRAIAAAALASLAGAGGYVVVQQARYAPPHDGAWPALWGRPHLLGWIAIAALAAEWLLSLRASREDADVVGTRGAST